MVETEIWENNPERPGYVSYKGQRLIKEVFEEVKTATEDHFKNSESAYVDYILLNHAFKNNANVRFPKGLIAVFVSPGSEAQRVNVVCLEQNGQYQEILSIKVWGERGAQEVCTFVQRLFFLDDSLLRSVA